MSLANRIAVMEAGRLVQVGSPGDIYRNPRSLFVATFVGEANVFKGQRRDGIVELPIGVRFGDKGADGPVAVVVRPESLSFQSASGDEWLSTSGTIVESVFLGSMVRYRIDVGGGTTVVVQGSSEDIPAGVAVGRQVSVGWRREQQSVLAA
jgi:ABC-type Fe3+/spermidine/putrescine transport system ATPase subunit